MAFWTKEDRNNKSSEKESINSLSAKIVKNPLTLKNTAAVEIPEQIELFQGSGSDCVEISVLTTEIHYQNGVTVLPTCPNKNGNECCDTACLSSKPVIHAPKNIVGCAMKLGLGSFNTKRILFFTGFALTMIIVFYFAREMA